MVKPGLAGQQKIEFEDERTIGSDANYSLHRAHTHRHTHTRPCSVRLVHAGRVILASSVKRKALKAEIVLRVKSLSKDAQKPFISIRSSLANLQWRNSATGYRSLLCFKINPFICHWAEASDKPSQRRKMQRLTGKNYKLASRISTSRWDIKPVVLNRKKRLILFIHYLVSHRDEFHAPEFLPRH